MRNIIWSAPADADLRWIETWLATERPPASELATPGAIHARCAFLGEFPRGAPVLKDELRKRVIIGTFYIFMFRVRDTTIEIVRLFLERQDWQALL